jgi:hypothetical protein
MRLKQMLVWLKGKIDEEYLRVAKAEEILDAIIFQQ